MKHQVLGLCLLLTAGCNRATRSEGERATTSLERRVALVIGNSKYKELPAAPVSYNDANDVAAALRTLQFDSVEFQSDLNAADLKAALNKFSSSTVHKGDLALVYFSGHGAQAGGRNYLLPVDYSAPADASQVERAGAYPVESLLDQLENSPARVRTLILDASRGAEITTSRANEIGLHAMRGRPEGTLIAYSAPPGETSPLDQGRHGFYTAELLPTLTGMTQDLTMSLDEVQLKVYRLTKGRAPYLSGIVNPPLYLRSTARRVFPPAELDAWISARNSGTRAAYQAYIQSYPNGEFTELANMKIAAGGDRGSIPEVAAGETKFNPADGQFYSWVPPGEIEMKCGDETNLCGEREKPAVRIKFSHGFRIGQTEATVGAWKRFRKATSAPALPTSDADGRTNLNEASGNDSMPSVGMTLDSARAFCSWIGGRLPKEEEWEYAARAGRTTPETRWWDSAWYAGNSGNFFFPSGKVKSRTPETYDAQMFGNHNGPHPVGQKPPNPWKLFDTLGNVAEWVEPRLPGVEAGLVRGGSWTSTEFDMFWDKRAWVDPSAQQHDIGVRCIWDTK